MGVDDEEDEVCSLHGDVRLDADLLVEPILDAAANAAGVDERTGDLGGRRRCGDTVAGDAWLVVDDGDLPPGKAVEEGGLPDIRASYDGDGRHEARCMEEIRQAQGRRVFSGNALISPGPAEFVEVGEVLRPAGGLLGEDQVGFPEVMDGDAVHGADHRGFPCFVEVRQAGQRGEEIDLAGRNTYDVLKTLMREVFLCHFYQGQAELIESAGNTCGIFDRGLDPEIDVLGVSWLGVVDYGVSPHNHILNAMLCEDA